MTDPDEFAQWRAELTANVERSITTVEKRLADLRNHLQHVDEGTSVTPNAELVATEVLQLVLLASRLDQLIDLDRETRDDIGPLLGVRDIAALLGVSNQRASELHRTNPRFPRPLSETSSGPVWRKVDVDAFHSTWERKPGRPKKTKEN